MKRSRAPAAHFSIHDVEPAGLPGVRALVDVMRDAGLGPPLLLVVAGAGWTSTTLDDLRSLVAAGCGLAGHGWSHRARPPRSLHHRVHAAVLSRDQAEHLSRPRAELRSRVLRCHAWFGEHGFRPPRLYVPPAWALGALTSSDLRELPFRYYEILTGFIDADRARRVRLPLVGFEADTRLRRWGLRLSNAVNRGIGRWLRRPVRIGFHPRDLELELAEDVRRIVRRPWTEVSVEDII